jgi:hypothetical protein
MQMENTMLLSLKKHLKLTDLLSQPTREMNGPFKKQFGQSDFTQFNLLTAYHKVHSETLVKAKSRCGNFRSDGVRYLSTQRGEKEFHVSILTAEAMAKIAGFKAKEFALIEKEALLTALKKALPNAKISDE